MHAVVPQGADVWDYYRLYGQSGEAEGGICECQLTRGRLAAWLCVTFLIVKGSQCTPPEVFVTAFEGVGSSRGPPDASVSADAAMLGADCP